MRTPDYEYYRNVYHGRDIQAAEDFAYFSDRAGDELARFSRFVPPCGEDDLLRCMCAVADILAQESSTSRNGQPVASESVNGYYSVNYGARVSGESRINKAVSRYIGRWICRAVQVTE